MHEQKSLAREAALEIVLRLSDGYDRAAAEAYAQDGLSPLRAGARGAQ